jgi:hypothetical protein
MDHLTQGYVGFLPRSGVSPNAKLLVTVDLPSYQSGSEASVVAISSDGRPTFFDIRLNRRGNGSVRVPFGRGKVDVVDLVITNASLRTTCWQDETYTFSCGGIPKDDQLAFFYGATLLQ